MNPLETILRIGGDHPVDRNPERVAFFRPIPDVGVGTPGQLPVWLSFCASANKPRSCAAILQPASGP